MCSGGGVIAGACGVGGVSGEVESDMRKGREDGSTGYGGDAVTGVGMYEERAGVGSGVTCEYTVGGVAA